MGEKVSSAVMLRSLKPRNIVRMSLKIGDRLPDATVTEAPVDQYNDEMHCPMPPQPQQISELIKGKRVAIVGVPGAFTPTCAGRHLPSYLEELDALKARGVEEVFFIAVSDGWVMHECGKSQNALGKIRFLGDGEGQFAKACGLDLVIPTMGLRNRRFSMVVQDGVVQASNVDAKAFETTDAKTLLGQLNAKQ